MRKIYLLVCIVAITILSAIKSYSQITITATAGVPGPTVYGTLSAAFNAINIGTHQGVINLSVTASTAEPGACTLNRSGTGAASYTSVTIKPAPAATPTISGIVASNALVKILGDFVTIDGSNTVGGTTRDLTISNTSATNPSVLWFGSGAATSIHDFTVKNTVLLNGSTNSSNTVVGDGTTLGNPGNFYNGTFQNNSVQRAWIGMFIRANPVAGNGIGMNVIGNDLNSSVATGINLCGIYLEGVDGTGGTVSNNIVGNFSTATAAQKTGIWLATNTINATVSNNTINGMTGPAGAGFTLGISVSSGVTASNNNISGNTISGLSNAGTGVASGVLVFNTTGGVNVQKNKVSNIRNTNATGFGSNGIELNSTIAGANINVYNNFIWDVASVGFAGGFTVNDNGNGIAVISGSGYKLLYNTVNLTTNQSAGNSAAILVNGVTTAGALDIRNNIISNSQTLNNRYGIYSANAATVYSAIDYNNYYSVSGNLGNIAGVNRTTIAAMQAGFGGNVNSMTMLPTYMSGTDHHLQLIPANAPLMAGIPIATVTQDIDGETRSATAPTIGADELPPVQIIYTTLGATCSNGDITLSGVTINSLAGVPVSGADVARIYFKKGVGGTWYSNVGTLTAGSATAGTWSFTITPASMGGVLGGDVIYYYVTAQSVSGDVVANPAPGFVATNVNTVISHPTTPNQYTVNAVSLAGLSTTQSVCFNASAASSASYTYTGSAGAPNQYTLTWSPAGPTNVAAFTALPASPLNVNVPAGTAAGTYTGTLTIRNSTTLCTNTYTLTLTVNPLPAAITGTAITCAGVTTTLSTASSGGNWSITPTAIATIGALNGVVTGVATGTATVTYTLPTSCFITTIVTVTTPPAAITGPGVVCAGSTIALANSVVGGSWSSASTTIATVGSNTGIVTGASGGTTTISYLISTCPAATTTITVNPLPAAIGGPLGVCQGYTTTLTNSTPGGTWTSSVGTVATISSSGVVSGIAAGTSTITYQLTATGCYQTAVVTVHPVPGAIGGPSVICAGVADLMTNSASGGVWTSSNTSVATIGSLTGTILGSSNGTTTITYTLGGSCTVTKPVTVSLAPSSISGPSIVCTGKTITMTNSISGGVWSSTSEATISTSGILTGVNPGVATISYTTAACTPATKLVTVNQNPAVITGTTNVCEGGSTTLSNATPGGAWTSSNPAVPVSSSGVVTGLSVGIVTVISYTLPNGCFSAAPITVDSLPDPIMGLDSICQFSATTLTDVTVGGLWSSSDGTKASIVAATGVVTGLLPGVVTISYTLVSGCYVTKPFKVRTPLPAAVTIERIPDYTVCDGTPVMFVAHPVNGGPAPAYRWQKFTLDFATGDTMTYVPTHGDFISLYMTVDSICAAPDPSYASLYVNVYPNGVTPIVNITTTKVPNVISYLGEVVTFYSDVTFGGTTTTYQWYVNDVPVPGATNSSYTMEVYRSIVVYCKVTGNPPCASSTTATSNTIMIYGLDGVNSIALGSAEFALFPNPNTGAFTLNGTINNGSDEELAIEVTNMLGQVVYRGTTIPRNGNVSHQVALDNELAAGSYLMRVSAGAVNQTFHFVISK